VSKQLVQLLLNQQKTDITIKLQLELAINELQDWTDAQ
jgi:hypothetical protein